MYQYSSGRIPSNSKCRAVPCFRRVLVLRAGYVIGTAKAPPQSFNIHKYPGTQIRLADANPVSFDMTERHFAKPSSRQLICFCLTDNRHINRGFLGASENLAYGCWSGDSAAHFSLVTSSRPRDDFFLFLRIPALHEDLFNLTNRGKPRSEIEQLNLAAQGYRRAPFVLPRAKVKSSICNHHFIADPLCPLLQKLKIGLIVLEDISQRDPGIFHLGLQTPIASELVGDVTVFHVQKSPSLALPHQTVTPVIAAHR